MSVLEKDGWLRIEGGFKEIVDYSRKLLSEKEYFGAFARVHTLVEVWMEILLRRQIAREKPEGPAKGMQMLEARGKTHCFSPRCDERDFGQCRWLIKKADSREL